MIEMENALSHSNIMQKALNLRSILILQKSKKQSYSSIPNGNEYGLVVIDVEFSGRTSSD